jgi:hypothetical protein
VVEQPGERVAAGARLLGRVQAGVGQGDRRLGGVRLEQLDLTRQERLRGAGERDEHSQRAVPEREGRHAQRAQGKLAGGGQPGELGHPLHVVDDRGRLQQPRRAVGPAFERRHDLGGQA